MRDIFAYDEIIQKLRNFFQAKKGFIEVPSQARLSILAACEDPTTISRFSFNNLDFPLPQTGQMWLEAELLKNPNLAGVFCISTSYRDEKNVIEGRHDKIFPMFEFESQGGIEELKKLETELLGHLGFARPKELNYEEACKLLHTDILEAEHEEKIAEQFGNSVLLQKFPQRTSPFWNMKHFKDGIFNKVDVLLYGMETIGSAERSTSVQEMRDNFLKISKGKYAGLLFGQFGQERVMQELDEYLSFSMFPRFGGGIGITRMARAMKLANLLSPQKVAVPMQL